MMPASESSKPRYLRLYFEPQDIDALCADLRGKGFAVTGPNPTNFGATAARIDGPDGYEIWFQQWRRPPSAK